MKKTNLEKIKKELEKGFGQKCLRFGIEYSWYNAHALDAGIQTRANNAKKWRKAVLELANEGEVTEKRVKIAYDTRYIGMRHTRKGATAYYVNGELRMFVSRGKIYDTENYEIVS